MTGAGHKRDWTKSTIIGSINGGIYMSMYRAMIRNIARNNLSKMDVKRLNKKTKSGQSKFSTSWKAFINTGKDGSIYAE